MIPEEDREVIRGHQRQTVGPGAVAAEDVLALTVAASIGGGGLGACPPSELEAVALQRKVLQYEVVPCTHLHQHQQRCH